MAWRVRRARRAQGARGAWRVAEGFWAAEGVVMLEGRANLVGVKAQKCARGWRERGVVEGRRVRRVGGSVGPTSLNATPTLAGGRTARPALAPV